MRTEEIKVDGMNLSEVVDTSTDVLPRSGGMRLLEIDECQLLLSGGSGVDGRDGANQSLWCGGGSLPD